MLCTFSRLYVNSIPTIIISPSSFIISKTILTNWGCARECSSKTLLSCAICLDCVCVCLGQMGFFIYKHTYTHTQQQHTHTHTKQLDIVTFVDKLFFLINHYKQTTNLKETQKKNRNEHEICK